MRAFSTSSVVVLMLLVVMGAAATPALAAAADHHHGDALFHAAATAPQLPRRMLKQEQHLSVGAGLPPGYRYNAEVDPYGTRNYVWMQRVEPAEPYYAHARFDETNGRYAVIAQQPRDADIYTGYGRRR